MANLEERGIKYVLDATDYVQGANQVADASKKVADSTETIASGTGKANASLSNTRYALYDVASTYKQISVASLAAMTAVTATGMSFETAFTGVERTADLPVQKLQDLRDELVNLSTEIPESFTNL